MKYFILLVIVFISVLLSSYGFEEDSVIYDNYNEDIIYVVLRDTSGGAPCNISDSLACGANNSQGECLISNITDTGECVCEDAYADTDCSYERKSQKTAFIYSLILGSMGADRFYLGYIVIGIVKLLLSLSVIIPSVIGCATRCCTTKGKKNLCWGIAAVAGFCTCFLTMAAMVWWVVDWSLILAKSSLYEDYNGYALDHDLT